MIALSAHSTGVAPPSGAHRYMLASTARHVCRVGWCPPTPSACAAFGTSLTCHAAPPSHSSIGSASPSSQDPQSQPSPSFSHQGSATTHGSGLMLTLERSVGHSSGNDAQLCASGLFQAEVFPDLPIATTWGNLAKALLPRQGGASEQQQHSFEVAAPGVMKVTTVAVNLRSMSEVERRILSSTAPAGTAGTAAATGQQAQTGSSTPKPQAAGALLFVSGSHPVRSLPGVSRLLPSSVTALRLAAQLKAQGHVPPSTGLWAVANPNTEGDASWAEAKVDAGAQVMLTQPPLDRAAFERWLDDAHRRGLPSRMRLLVGMPFLSSPSNLAFWISLANCLGRPAARQLLDDFRRASGTGGKQGLADYCRQYNEELLASLAVTPGVAGLHVMPISPASRRLALQLLPGIRTAPAQVAPA